MTIIQQIAALTRFIHAPRGPWIAAVLLAMAIFPLSRPLHAAEITPFETYNQSALVQIFGLPAPGRAKVLKKGEIEGRVAIDWANNYAHDSTDTETIMLDGESFRTTMIFGYGIADRFEAGLELPVISQSGGILDGFIEGWHSFFHLPNGTRSHDPRDRLLYRYEKNGDTRLNVTHGDTGIGDIRLTGATQLYQGGESALALRGMLKFPTGDTESLLGSGSTDFALWLSGNHDYQLGSWGDGAIFGSIGGLAMTKGDVLRSQQRPLVGFGSLGAGWSPSKHLALKLQVSSHSPFYSGSDLVELNAFSSLLVVGGTIAFTEKTALDLGLSEDILIDRSPDIAFHVALTSRF